MAASKSSLVEIQPVAVDAFQLTLVGTTPLICNRMSEKARREILLPALTLTPSQRQSTPKHDPLAEFRASPYTYVDPAAPTLIALMASAFKGAMATAALDLPGARKSQIGRLVYVVGEIVPELVPIYGPVQLLMSVVRQAGINHAPDIRSRAILPRWACRVTVRYVTTLINRTSIGNLITAAGITAGVGDWRPEKGKGDYGQFRIAPENDAEFAAIQIAGRRMQQGCMDDPTPYDRETAELLEWAGHEATRRGFESPEQPADDETDENE